MEFLICCLTFGVILFFILYLNLTKMLRNKRKEALYILTKDLKTNVLCQLIINHKHQAVRDNVDKILPKGPNPMWCFGDSSMKEAMRIRTEREILYNNGVDKLEAWMKKTKLSRSKALDIIISESIPIDVQYINEAECEIIRGREINLKRI